MSSKINRLRAERGKNDEKIAVLRARNNEIDKQITELENLDIVGMVRSMGMTPEQLAALIQASKTDASALTGKEEEPYNLSVVLLSYISYGKEVALGLRHLLVIHSYVSVMHPVPCKRNAVAALGLGYFVFVVRELKVLSACVNVDGVSQVLFRHGGTLDVPARTAHSPRGFPGDFVV